MSPQQALQLLDEVASKFQGNRIVHSKLQEAVGVIADLVTKQSDEILPDDKPKK